MIQLTVQVVACSQRLGAGCLLKLGVAVNLVWLQLQQEMFGVFSSHECVPFKAYSPTSDTILHADLSNLV